MKSGLFKNSILLLSLFGTFYADIKQIKFYYGNYTIENPLPWGEDEVVTVEANNSLQGWDRVRVEVIEDEEESGLPFGYTHRRAYYPDGPEIKGDGIDDYWDDPDPQHKDVWVEIDIIDEWDAPWLNNIELIKSVAKSILESAVKASTIPEIETNYNVKYQSGIIIHFYNDVDTIPYMDEYYRLSVSEAQQLFSAYRNHNNAVHVIFGFCDDFDTDHNEIRIGGVTIHRGLSDTNLHDDNRVWNIKMSGGESRMDCLDQCGIVIFNHNLDDAILTPLRDSILGFILAHEIGHALGMTHVCDMNYAVTESDSNWHWYNFWHHFGNVMYPRTYLADTNSTKFNYFFHVASHFLLQSLEDSNDWTEAEDPADLDNLNFKSRPGYRDVLGVHNVCAGLKGWLMSRFPKDKFGVKPGKNKN